MIKNISLKVFLLSLLFIFITGVIPVYADFYIPSTKSPEMGIPMAYDVDRVIMNFPEGIGSLSNPSDLFFDKKDILYVVDTGNNRIIKLDKNGQFLAAFYGPKEDPLNKPQGIYVDDEGDMYVADTDNGRIVHLSPEGNFVEQFTQPKEDTYHKEYAFKPIKVYIDAVGRIYAINNVDYHGLITLDAKNKFLGYLAQSKIKFDPMKVIIRAFATEEQKKQIARDDPPYFSNFLIHSDGLIYATSYLADKQQIKKLTPSGNNVYADKMFGIKNGNVQTFGGMPAIVDLAVTKGGIILAADAVRCQLYVYDQEGNNLAVFAGKGNRKGSFEGISSIALNSDEELYVLDNVLGTIQVLKPTRFMTNVMKATNIYNDGNYDQAIGPWKSVLQMDSSYSLAQVGIAKAKFRQTEYKKAMQLSLDSGDQAGYSESFYEFRLQAFRDNFALVVISFLLIVVLLYFVIKYTYKLAGRLEDEPYPDRDITGLKFFGHMVLLVIFHPISGFAKLKKYRDRLKIWPVLLIVLLIAAVRIAYLYTVHFPLADILPQYADFWQEVARIFVPLISWFVVCYAITSISDGKQTFMECMSATAYSMIPYIVFTMPIAAFSNLLCTKEVGIYKGLNMIIMLWCIYLILLYLKTMNEYTLVKTVFNTCKILFSIMCTWMFCGLFYIIVVQFVEFIRQIYFEFLFMI